MIVKTPEHWRQNVVKQSYRLRVTGQTQDGDVFSAEAPGEIVVDLEKCIDRCFNEGVDNQEKEKYKEAVKAYTKAEETRTRLIDRTALSMKMAKNYFNRALSNVLIGLNSEESEDRKNRLFSKAIVDLTDAINVDGNDSRALFIRGLLRQLRQDYETALDDYHAALKISPQMTEAHKFKGVAYVRIGVKSRLPDAIDAFTDALIADASDSDLRKLRYETLKLLLKHEEDEEDTKIDISGLPLPDIGKVLDFKKYLRK
jgi:tetratricopeptide (TPR) repeat protein